jgi:lysozyme family protein
MTTLPETRSGLEALRATLSVEYKAAKAAGDTEKMRQLTELAGEIDDELDDLLIADLDALAHRFVSYHARLATLTRTAVSWPFGTAEAPPQHERLHREAVSENDFEDEGPKDPPPKPAPVPSDVVPTVSGGWSENYRQLWGAMTIQPEWQKSATAIAQKIIAHQARYAAAVSATKVPWWFVAVLHTMECSLRFDQHLHNGDPLTARTTRIPSNRPPSGAPPFTWEASARDAIACQRLDAITDWSLESALFHWHRYNGINNEYKRRGIPTPYLWSGSQHYRKGKYVADGMFNADAVSAQVGAAVLLRSLIDLGAVTLGPKRVVTSNPAAAAGDVSTLKVDISGAAFRHVAGELNYPGHLKKGAAGSAARKLGARRVQEWLNIHGFRTPIDSAFEDSTSDQLKAFQAKAGREPTGELDEETWALLTTPMRKALAPVDRASSMSLEEVVIAAARQHADQRPVEVGGNNRGPWVRLYMEGREGEEQKWCAGFVCFIIAQAARDLGVAAPFPRQVWVPSLVGDAKTGNRFVPEGALADPLQRRSRLKPGDVFVVRQSSTMWTHTGFVLSLNESTFDTIEGNTGGDGGADGPNAGKGNRSFRDKDFLHLL